MKTKFDKKQIAVAIGGTIGAAATAAAWLSVSPRTWGELGWIITVLLAGFGMAIGGALTSTED